MTTKHFGTSYTDEWNHLTELTPAEVEFFQEAVASALIATGISVDIWTCDHEQIPGHENALGIHYRAMDDPSDEFITIDNYFIHERYRVEREGYPWTIEPETLLEVICHELAHMKYRYHSKYHAALTKKLLETVNDAA